MFAVAFISPRARTVIDFYVYMDNSLILVFVCQCDILCIAV